MAGINRLAAIQIAEDQGYELVERDIARGELYQADEIFMTGTAAELTPIREVDDLAVGDGTRGPVTAEIQAIFEDALHGRSARYAEWLDRVPAAGLMNIIVYDTTLRDGMQGEGMSLSVEEKVRVARSSTSSACR